MIPRYLLKICTETRTINRRTVTYTLYRLGKRAYANNGFAISVSGFGRCHICKCGREIDLAAAIFKKLILGNATPTNLQDIVDDYMELLYEQ